MEMEMEREVKRRKGEDERRRWDELSPEILALLLEEMAADEICRTVPFVCRGWREATLGSYFWSNIELQQWCRRVNRSDVIQYAVCRLIRRSRGTLRRLSANGIGDTAFQCTAINGKVLRVLQIPMSDITDEIVLRCADQLSRLNFLDISNCLKITHKGIEAFGKNCKSLVHLRRNLPPPGYCLPVKQEEIEEDEALAISRTMTGIHHLEVCYGRFSDEGLRAVLRSCSELVSLDIRGCWGAKLDGAIEDECFSLKEFKEPYYDEYDFYISSDSEADDNDSETDDGDDN